MSKASSPSPADSTRNHAYEQAAVGLCYLDKDLRYVYINKWLADLNGLSIRKHLGKLISKVLPDVAAGVTAQLQQVIDTNVPIINGAVEAETFRDNGVKRRFQHNFIPVTSRGKVVGVSCLVQEVGLASPLKMRQRQVLQLLAEGQTMNEAADSLGVTHSTIAFHKYAIMRQLDLNTTADLVRYSIRYGITSLEDKSE